jgi:hypothetical protein
VDIANYGRLTHPRCHFGVILDPFSDREVHANGSFSAAIRFHAAYEVSLRRSGIAIHHTARGMLSSHNRVRCDKMPREHDADCRFILCSPFIIVNYILYNIVLYIHRRKWCAWLATPCKGPVLSSYTPAMTVCSGLFFAVIIEIHSGRA